MSLWAVLLIALVTTWSSQWLMKPSTAPAVIRDGVSIVRAGPRLHWLLWGAIALFMGYGLYQYLTFDGQFPQLRSIPLQGALVMSLLLGGPMALLVYRSGVRYDGDSVTFGRMYRGPVTVRWDEITAAYWHGQPTMLRVEWRDGGFNVWSCFDGSGDFVAALRSRGVVVPLGAWEVR